jgi:TRAP-type C4-dicarboxylate transport system permease small subunit
LSNADMAQAGGGTALFLRAYNALILGIAGTTMALTVIVMAVQVFYRYALNDSLIWAEEVCRYLLIVMTFVLIGPAFQRGEMVSVQFLVSALPHRAARAVMIPLYLMMIGFLLVISYFGWRYAAFNGSFAMPAIDFILTSLTGRQVSGALTMYWIYMLIPLGCIMLSLHLATVLAQTARELFMPGKAA